MCPCKTSVQQSEYAEMTEGERRGSEEGVRDMGNGIVYLSRVEPRVR